MFHAGLAGELARTLSEDRRAGSGRRLLSSADRARLDARAEAERSDRAFEQALSVGGAATLLATVLVGGGAAVLVAFGLAVAIALTGHRAPPTSGALRTPADPDLRWTVWRRVEPDAEYLRGRAT